MNDRIDTWQWQRLGALFEQAVSLDAQAQAELLQTVTSDDAGLAQALGALLAADARHHAHTIEHRERVLQGSLAALDALDVGVGDRVGPYVLCENLGEGGMGVVFRAERVDGQVHQEVALKVVKHALLDARGRERFLRERQIVAAFEHPHIARIMDVGATPSGRPYFAMELVRGEPISTWCSNRDLPIVERLRLFDQVCSAVMHAHTKGVIHRDLKPSNVLVGMQDDAPFVKVIDFGIAKATHERAASEADFTAQFLMVGTPLYMSPEQAAGSADIDTRTDIYALGVLLYELLTDTTPIDANSLRSAAYPEVQRIIREVDPPRPSVRLSQSAATTARCGMEPRQLARRMRGELDWIVMKAIEKDRDRRYETANALALDVRRYLAGEAVLAAPPGTAYRMRTFVRRNKGPVAAGALIAAALLAGIAGFAWQAHIAQQQAYLAHQRANEVEQVARFEAGMLRQMNPALAGRQLVDDMQSRFAAALVKAGVPASERAGLIATFAGHLQRINATDTARDLIDRTTLKPAIAEIDRQFRNQPVVAATLQQVLADRYVEMGLFEAAMPLQQRALATRRHVLGENAPDTIESIGGMAELLKAEGKFSEAEPFFREVIAKSRRVNGADNKLTVTMVSEMGALLDGEGKLAEAERYLREASETTPRVPGEGVQERVELLDALAWTLLQRDKLGEAESVARDALVRSRHALGDEHPDTLFAIYTLGHVLDAQDKPGEAEPYFRLVLEKRRRVLGEEHQDTLESTLDLGELLVDEGKLGEAELYLREAAGKSRRALGDQDLVTLSAVIELGEVLAEQGRLESAEPYLREG